jgi:hypothetical protein
MHSVSEHHFYKPPPYARLRYHQVSLFYTNLVLALGFALIGLIVTAIYLILGIPTEFVTPLG